MSSSARLSPPAPLGLDPILVGTAYCVASALAYTAANSVIRALAFENPAWVICVKETVTVAVVGPWLAYLALRGKLAWPSRRALVVLALVGLAVQTIGNLGLVWAFRQIGLSITIPAMMGMNLASSALLGWCVLREPVTRRTLAAIGILIVAIMLLRMGASQAGGWITASPLQVGLGLLAATIAGLTFATMAVAIRKTVTGTVSPAVILLVITATGTLSLGPLSLWQLGLPAILATPPDTFGLMLLAGLLNLIAFFAITKGLQYATVVQANVLSASQVAMAAIVGMLFFQESPTPSLLVGVGLTVAGMVMIERPS